MQHMIDISRGTPSSPTPTITVIIMGNIDSVPEISGR